MTVECQICHEKLYRITYIHLWKKHGITPKEYKKRFPDAPIASTERKPIKKIKDKHKQDKQQHAVIRIYEQGKPISLSSDVPTTERFRKYREAKGWTITEALNTLIDHDIEYEQLKQEIKEREELESGTKKIPMNFSAYHRDKLQEILSILEEKAKKEKDAVKLAQIADKIARINQILPTLDKTYDNDIDAKIQEITEKRKAICRNYLYETGAFPWSVKKKL